MIDAIDARQVQMQIRHLCKHISDKNAVRHYMNEKHKLNLTLQDIAAAQDARP